MKMIRAQTLERHSPLLGAVYHIETATFEVTI